MQFWLKTAYNWVSQWRLIVAQNVGQRHTQRRPLGGLGLNSSPSSFFLTAIAKARNIARLAKVISLQCIPLSRQDGHHPQAGSTMPNRKHANCLDGIAWCQIRCQHHGSGSTLNTTTTTTSSPQPWGWGWCFPAKRHDENRCVGLTLSRAENHLPHTHTPNIIFYHLRCAAAQWAMARPCRVSKES